MSCFSSIVKVIIDALTTSIGGEVRNELKTLFRSVPLPLNPVRALQVIRQIVSPGVESRPVVKDLATAES